MAPETESVLVSFFQRQFPGKEQGWCRALARKTMSALAEAQLQTVGTDKIVLDQVNLVKCSAMCTKPHDEQSVKRMTSELRQKVASEAMRYARMRNGPRLEAQLFVVHPQVRL